MLTCRAIVAALCLAATCGLAAPGCRQAPPAPEARPGDPDRTTWEQAPLPIKQGSVTVAEGPTPLVYLFDIGGPIRVTDVRADRQLVAMEIPGRTIVRVDDRNGVVVGGQVIVPGPLPTGGRYAIIQDPSTPNIVRQGVGPPGDAPVGTSPATPSAK